MKTLYVLSVTLSSLPDTFPHHRTVLFFYDILQFSRACWPCLLSLIHSYPAHLCSVLHVFVFGNYPKHFNKINFFEIDLNSCRRYINCFERHIFRIIGIYERFDFNRVKKCHCFFLMALRFSTLAYHISNIANFGLNPRSLALSSISRK